MHDPLLMTKLFIPPPRSNLVPRPRLIEQLNAGLQVPLTLISAPAGYGKTSLLSEWRASEAGHNYPIAWISLDDDDNDPSRFLILLIAALGIIKPGIGEDALAKLQASQPSPVNTILTSLINDLVDLDHHFVLTLDDYHVIKTQSIHHALTFLLDHLPSQMHLVILSRVDPPLAVARLRGRSQLNEIRARDLRFTIEETTTFLNHLMGLSLSLDDVVALDRRTEGWAAGLQLAGLSMQGRADVHGFVSEFTGSNYYILDYLVEEVLNRQSEVVRSFLLQTSFLGRLSGPLCEIVTQTSGGQMMLEKLEQANLFLFPLDDERRWFRYHNLFGDMLHNRLRLIYPDKCIGLYGRAAQWFEQNGYLEDALQYALNAKDFTRATRLIEKAARIILEREGISVMLSWLKAFPNELIRSDPRLCVYYAWTLAHSGHLDEIEPLLQSVETMLKEGKVIPEMAALKDGLENIDPLLSQAAGGLELRYRLPIIVDYLRACFERYRNLPRAKAYCEHALKQIPEGDIFDHSVALFFLGHIYLLEGEIEKAKQELQETIKESLILDNPDIYLSAANYLAQALMLEGKLHEATLVVTKVSQYTQERPNPILSGIELIRMGDIQLEHNDLQRAQDNIHRGVRLAEAGGDFVFLREGYIARARLDHSLGNFESAMLYLQKAEQVSQHAEINQGITPIRPLRARMYLAKQDLLAAERWAIDSGINPEEDLQFLNEYGLLTQVRILIAHDRLTDSELLLERLLQFTSTAGRNSRVIEVLILLALTYSQQAKVDQALETLKRALSFAETEDHIRIFLDVGESIVPLLQNAGSRGISPKFVTRLLSEFNKITGPDLYPQQPLIEPLSKREVEVLRLISAGKSNLEIAQDLVLSVGTVKSHISHIFGKLNVQKRTECVARARDLHLIP